MLDSENKSAWFERQQKVVEAAGATKKLLTADDGLGSVSGPKRKLRAAIAVRTSACI